jgi:hypothetical protein
VPLDNGSLLVFRFTGEGFVPSIIDGKPVKDINPISVPGQQVVEKHPILKQWAAGSPGSVPIESMITRTQKYSPLETARPRISLSGRPGLQGRGRLRRARAVLRSGPAQRHRRDGRLLAGLVAAAQRTRARACGLSTVRLERTRGVEQR